MGASVGSNVVVIGGGNSAVDSARSAKRVSKGDVRILCITEKMTAVKEDVDEAIKEGIPIDYNVSPMEILGDGTNVTGVRCQRVKNVTFEPDGKINMEYIPDSEFVSESRPCGGFYRSKTQFVRFEYQKSGYRQKLLLLRQTR